jgi:tetratricopeptide (TPR) repeat protein
MNTVLKSALSIRDTWAFAIVFCVLGSLTYFAVNRLQRRHAFSNGITEFQQSQFEAAEQHFRTAVDHKPGDPALPLALANSLYAQGKYDEALKIYQSTRFAEQPVLQTEALLNVASIYEIKNNLAGAEKELLKLIQVAPSLGEAHYRLGLVYLNKKDFSQASKSFNQALQIDPKSKVARFQLQRLEQMSPQATPAKSITQRKLASTDKPQTQSKKILARAKTGKKTAAKKIARKS